MKVATTEPHRDRNVFVIARIRPDGDVRMPLNDGHMIHRKIVPIIAVMSLLYDAPLDAERSSRMPACCSRHNSKHNGNDVMKCTHLQHATLVLFHRPRHGEAKVRAKRCSNTVQ